MEKLSKVCRDLDDCWLELFCSFAFGYCIEDRSECRDHRGLEISVGHCVLGWLRNSNCCFEWSHKVIEAELKFSSDNVSHSGDEAQGLELEWLVLFSDGLVEVPSKHLEYLNPIFVDETAMVFTLVFLIIPSKQALAEIERGESCLSLELKDRVGFHKLDEFWSKVSVIFDLNAWSEDSHKLAKGIKCSMLNSNVRVHDTC